MVFQKKERIPTTVTYDYATYKRDFNNDLIGVTELIWLRNSWASLVIPDYVNQQNAGLTEKNNNGTYYYSTFCITLNAGDRLQLSNIHQMTGAGPSVVGYYNPDNNNKITYASELVTPATAQTFDITIQNDNTHIIIQCSQKVADNTYDPVVTVTTYE